MNYFGHAAVASLRESEPRFVLGAMLPDLLPMAALSVPRSFEDPEVSRGISFHIETDAVFHATQSFITWNRVALATLRDLGVSRGPARASAHMGVEMLIDAEWTARDDAFDAYERALGAAVDAPEVLRPMPKGDQERARALLAHLLDRGRAVFAPSAERFSLRLGRTLALRPRLCPSTHELVVVANYLSAFETPRSDLAELLLELEPLWSRPIPTSSHLSRPAS